LPIVGGGRTRRSLDHSGDNRFGNRIRQKASHCVPPGDDGIQVSEVRDYVLG
jgi:hypothetical protein